MMASNARIGVIGRATAPWPFSTTMISAKVSARVVARLAAHNLNSASEIVIVIPSLRSPHATLQVNSQCSSQSRY